MATLSDEYHLPPGIYKPYIDMYVPHNEGYIATEDDMWKKNDYFVVSKHEVSIGEQLPYEYYSVKRLGKYTHSLVKSYEVERWNVVAQILKRANTMRERFYAR